MVQENELERLEKFVGKMLEKVSTLNTANDTLKAAVADKDAKIAELEGIIAELQGEKANVSQRVAKLIDQIQDWEAQEDAAPSDTPVFEGVAEPISDSDVGEEGEAMMGDDEDDSCEESLSEEASAESRDDNSAESRQGSLFSAGGAMLYSADNE